MGTADNDLAPVHHWSSRDWVLFFILALSPFVFFPGVIRGDSSVVIGDGIVDLPYRIAVARYAFSGEWPFWEPNILGGVDIWSYPASGVLNPLTYLFGIFPVFWTLNILTLLTYSLALGGAYVFARKWGISRGGSSAAAFAYAYSGFFISFHDFAVHGMAAAAAFMPLLLAAYFHLGERPGPRRAALAALATLWMGIVPQEQVFVYSMVHAGFVTMLVSLRWEAGKKRKVWLWAAMAVLLGTVAFSVRILPTLDLVKYSVREDIVSLAESSYRVHNVARWRTLIDPFEDTHHMSNLYFGLAPLFLTVFGLLNVFRKRTALWAAVGLGIGFAGVMWVHAPPSWTQGLPVLGWFHSPFRHLFEVYFWAAVLAGMGMDLLIGEGWTQRRRIKAAFITSIAPAVLVIVAIHLFRRYTLMDSVNSFAFFNLVFFTVAGASALFLLKRRGDFKWPVLAILIIAIIVPSRVVFNRHMESRLEINGPLSLDPDRSPAVEFLKKHEKGSLSRAIHLGLFYGDTYTLDDRIGGAPPNTNMLFGLPLAQGKSELAPKRIESMIREFKRTGLYMDTNVFNGSGAALDLLNVKYVFNSKAAKPIISSEEWESYREGLIENRGRGVVVNVLFESPVAIGFNKIEKGAEIVLLVSHHEGSLQAGSKIAEISLSNSGGGRIRKVLLAREELDGRSPKLLFDYADKSGRIVQVKTLLYEIRFPAGGGGPYTLDLNVVSPGVELKIDAAAWLDPKGRVIGEIPIVDGYLETTLGYRIIYNDPYVNVFERPDAFPRQWLASKIHVGSPEGFLNALKEASRNRGMGKIFRTLAFVENPELNNFADKLDALEPDRNASIERLVDNPGFISAKISSKTPVFAVFSEAWARGWKATLDGKPVDVYIADYYLRGIPVPAGEHVIEMRYRPPGIVTGLILSLLGLAAIIGLAALPSSRD